MFFFFHCYILLYSAQPGYKRRILCWRMYCVPCYFSAVEKRNIGRSVCPCVPEEDSQEDVFKLFSLVSTFRPHWLVCECVSFLLSHWQLLIKSGAEKQDITQQPISVWIMSYLSLSLAFPSATPLLWIPFTQADRSSRWRKKKTPHTDIELPSESVQIIFRLGQLYRETLDLEDFKDFLKVWGEFNFVKCWRLLVSIRL